MKYEISEKEINSIKRKESEDPTMDYLLNKPSTHNFNVGDILILMIKRGEEWKPQCVSSTSRVPKKYVYIYENKVGVGYVRQINSDGKLGEHVTSMATFRPLHYRFELDPGYADHLILSPEENYDPIDAFKKAKEHRELANKENKKLLAECSTHIQRAKILEQLKVGDKFHMGRTLSGVADNVYEVVKVTDYPNYAGYNSESWKEIKKNNPGLVYRVVECRLKDSYTSKIDVFSFGRFFSLKPLKSLKEDK